MLKIAGVLVGIAVVSACVIAALRLRDDGRTTLDLAEQSPAAEEAVTPVAAPLPSDAYPDGDITHARARVVREQLQRASASRRSVEETRADLLARGYSEDEFAIDVIRPGISRVVLGLRPPLVPGGSNSHDLMARDEELFRRFLAGTRIAEATSNQCLDAFWKRGGKVVFHGRSHVFCNVVTTVRIRNGTGRVMGVETRPEWCAQDYDEETAACVAAAYTGVEFSAPGVHEFRYAEGFCVYNPEGGQHE